MTELDTPDWYPLPPEGTGLHRIPDSESVKNEIPADRQQSEAGKERPKALKLQGRLAATPHFDIRGDHARVNFVLAQRQEDGSAVYHSMYSTREYAKRLSGKGLAKGQIIEVTGVWQTHVTKGKQGELVERKVFYCYGAKVQ
jgi:hypothetical protein